MRGGGTLSVEMTCGDAELRMPAFRVEVEFAFLVNLIRKATKQDISPVAAEMQEVPEDSRLQSIWDALSRRDRGITCPLPRPTGICRS
jgi:hypothetical protein